MLVGVSGYHGPTSRTLLQGAALEPCAETPGPEGGESSGMRPYEVMIILNPTLEESSIRDQVDRSAELIRASGGTPGRVDQWGRRRLAYEIDHQREGYYILLEATAEPGAQARRPT